MFQLLLNPNNSTLHGESDKSFELAVDWVVEDKTNTWRGIEKKNRSGRFKFFFAGLILVIGIQLCFILKI